MSPSVFALREAEDKWRASGSEQDEGKKRTVPEKTAYD